MIKLQTTIKMLLITSVFFTVSAQSGEPFEMDSSVQAPSGGAASAGDFQLKGTLGQPVVGHTSGGGFTLHSGFWATTPLPNDLIFADDFE